MVKSFLQYELFERISVGRQQIDSLTTVWFTEYQTISGMMNRFRDVDLSSVADHRERTVPTLTPEDSWFYCIFNINTLAIPKIIIIIIIKSVKFE